MNFNRDLARLAEKVKIKKQLEERLQRLEKQKNSAEAQGVQLQLKLEEAQESLEQVDKPGFTNLLITVMGSKKEEREFWQTNVDSLLEKRQNVQAEVVRIRRQMADYQAEIKLLGDCERQYISLMESGKELNDEQLKEYSSIRNREILGALNAGRKIMKYIDNIEKSLGEAKFWNILDIIGGNHTVWADKYNRLDDANIQVTDLKTAVRDFKAHMKKVIIYIDYNFTISKLMMAADLMLDGLVTDAVVNSRINQFQFEIGDFRKWMESLLNQLEKELN